MDLPPHLVLADISWSVDEPASFVVDYGTLSGIRPAGDGVRP